MSLGFTIKKIREELKISQEQLARELNISFSTINRWENNKTNPSRLAKDRLCTFCENKLISSEIITELTK
ncbi:transcriptional regulator [Paenibacillus sp. FSL H8-0548]|uniref:helix-turn-helix domain-containing protein n=1 Tax=unclassified Paenibacillus TaxID=185978 RepID=UPI00096FF4F0|nr:helix-turn-helix transcriptional regulator [Paenibacillus sp. FSL H8-0548]OMF38234.1 transcriptional regulator [Paenibacillus sp. FSL H8-0548]